MKPQTEQEKKEFSNKTIKLGKELDIIFAVIKTIDDDHLKNTYNAIREQWEKIAQLDQSIHANKIATELLNSQCSTLLKITELKRVILKANETKNLISGNKEVKKSSALKSVLNFIKNDKTVN